MITAAKIKEKAKKLGASVCGIGDIKYFIGDDPQHNPISILPNARCIIGFGIPSPVAYIWQWRSKDSISIMSISV